MGDVGTDGADNGDGLVSELRVLIDRDSPPASQSFEVEDAYTVDDVQFQLMGFFGRPGAPQAVNVIVDGKPAGVISRQSLNRAGGTMAGPAAEVGGGERIQLPGLSARYRLLVFACPSCGGEAYRIHYDERDVPACKHGPMELRR
jgi:hypothetical protein